GSRGAGTGGTRATSTTHTSRRGRRLASPTAGSSPDGDSPLAPRVDVLDRRAGLDARHSVVQELDHAGPVVIAGVLRPPAARERRGSAPTGGGRASRALRGRWSDRWSP